MMIKEMIQPSALKVNTFIESQFKTGVHLKTLHSLGDVVLGVLSSQSLQPSQIGVGLAEAKSLKPKHATKQVDRTLSNGKIHVGYCQYHLAKFLLANRKRIMVAMDWTVFAKDGQMTLTLRLVTKHGRATPLLWKTVYSEGLKGHKVGYVFQLLEKLRNIVAADCQVIILADREFGTLNNMKKMHDMLSFDYILRGRRNFTITDPSTKCKKLAYEWLKKEPLCIDNALITVKEYPVEKVVICKEPAMKEMWCLVCSCKNISTKTIMKYYGKRWSTETSYRDEKDLQFGFGLKKARIKTVERRDRLLLISALVIILLTLLGAACEDIGYSRYLKANTLKRRTHSLFTQGRMILRLLPGMKLGWREQFKYSLLRLFNGLSEVTVDQYVI